MDVVVPISDTLGVIVRSINLVLAVWVTVFSVRSIPRTAQPYQKARFLGLSLLAITIAWGTATRLHADVTLATLGFTVSLVVSVVGTLGFLRQPRSGP